MSRPIEAPVYTGDEEETAPEVVKQAFAFLANPFWLPKEFFYSGRWDEVEPDGDFIKFRGKTIARKRRGMAGCVDVVRRWSAKMHGVSVRDLGDKLIIPDAVYQEVRYGIYERANVDVIARPPGRTPT